jgi:hypothetical protein
MADWITHKVERSGDATGMEMSQEDNARLKSLVLNMFNDMRARGSRQLDRLTPGEREATGLMTKYKIERRVIAGREVRLVSRWRDESEAVSLPPRLRFD